jgi:hypothetical protein
LSQTDRVKYNSRQLEVSKEYLGKGQFVALKKFYIYSKKEIKLKIDK